ncbi:MAG TPA: VOC family protein [Polyangiaceae bacterium]|nr:VOC family protein [Polyangiaceae bacterium]
MASLLINLDVSDLELAARFYTQAFELRVGRRLGPKVVELLGAQAPIYLLEKPEGSLPFGQAHTPRAYARHWTPLHLDFVVADLEEALQRVQALGAQAQGSIEVHAWGRIAVLADPFGHGFCLLEFRGRGYDEIATP